MQLLRLAGNFFRVAQGNEDASMSRSTSTITKGELTKDFASCFPAFLIQDSGLALGW